MAQYSAIDESCDSSALLSMVINISSFPQAVQTAADKIRLEIRNSWAHCDFRNWTGEKYRNCLHIMGQFVKDISLSDTDRKRSLEELNTWNTYGQNYFLSETKRDVNITDAIRQQTHVLIEYVQHGLTETDNQIMEVKKELQDLESGLHERIKKLEDKTEKQDNKIQQLTHATEEIIRKQVEDPNPKFIRDLQDRPRDNEIRIVLLGRTGAGKSATGNSLLCQKYFLSLFSGSSVTANCKRGESERKGKKVVIVDTPGLFDTKAGNETITKEIVKCIAMTSPGPHAIVLVVSAGRFTPEDQNTVEHFKYHFGEGLFHHMIVLFTMKDELDKHNQSIDQHVETVPNYLKTILSQCGNRYIAFNNDHVGQSNTEQIDDFFEIVEKMCIENGGSCYTNEQYQEVEAELQRRMQMEKEALENQMEKEKETVRNEVEDKFNQKLEKEMEEKRKLKDILKSNIIKSEDEKVKLEKQIKEATEKHDQMLKKREKELEEKIQKTEDEFKQKMTENVLRTNQRNNVENDTGRLLMDIAGGVYSFFKLWFPK
ncbi:uncharacterized protein LOC143058765 [Mytilus galloprovincialis]|uniref:uncharacterized protein LOC143058765 n=1 Tax=Mytilus galloprovincialis TaxID=29158 RepID=UPI003F7B3E73